MTSIRVSLVAMLIAAFTLVSFLAALLGYRASMDRAEELLDTQLRYAVDILRYHDAVGAEATGANSPERQIDSPERQIDSPEPGADSPGPEGDKSLQPGEGFAFQVWRDDQLLQHAGVPGSEPMASFDAGFDYANFGGFRWRTLTVAGADGTWYQVAERADLRFTLAERVVMESVLPLLTWLPVAAVLIWFLVGWGLAPLRSLSQQINRKASDDLEPLVFPTPPVELRPVVGSTNALLARLSSALQRERDFASHAAHELRTPISGLKIHLHNLSQDLSADHPSLCHIRADVDRMQHLVEQLLDISRTQPELMRGHFATVNLHALAERVAASLWPLFSEAGLSLSLGGEDCTVQGDEVMLDTLLRNLLDNARKYAGRGSEVEVTTGMDEGRPCLVVTDDGPGIPAAERDQVFRRFYRVDDSSGVGGAGLGLAIVWQIAQLHGAEVRLDTPPPGKGLAVRVYFPVAEASQ
ncbi:HAMP domain-containing protein [Parahaliea maris]|uniref:histidine kinase n=1 Tax=Parahaliea maris TaxID=2716870 RepID=A0A5C9A9D0_9GAMM|nr:ATP-binding protein [Parahaliea maris]TXS96674.1 HAMP domain-containing protein [Parahaliea maris]